MLSAETNIGRDATNAIACESDAAVSRRHARVTMHGAIVRIEDLGSANGLYVNGDRITGLCELRPGDLIAFGSQRFRLDFDEPPGRSVPREQSRLERPQMSSRGFESSAPGCAMPRIDLPDSRGCLRFLLIMLVLFAAVLLIGGLLALVAAGIRSIGGGTGGSPGREATGGGPAGDAPGTGGQVSEGIRILSVQLVTTSIGRERVLVVWENATSQPITRVWGDVTLWDASGREVGLARDVLIYSGAAIPPGGRHSDRPEAGQGFDAPITPVKPARAGLEPSRYE